MSKPKIAGVVGARPNFMKMAPLVEAFRPYSDRVDFQLVHTGQHYDARMSENLFEQLGLPEPDFFLGVGSGSHAEQTARILVAFEKYCRAETPDLAVVVGDVNSTLACALVAAKERIPVAHVEAGLRSGDRSMPEEINRLLTDALSDLLFTTCREADRNLAAEGISADKIHFVGNVMIDSLKKFLPKARPPKVLDRLGEGEDFGVVTLHRPSNVDDPAILRSLIETLQELSDRLPLLFPCHPRALRNLSDLGLIGQDEIGEEGMALEGSRVWLCPPLGYLEFLYLLDRSSVILSDSGGIQEEATVLGTPCLTLRENTERAITLEGEANILVGNDPKKIKESFAEVLAHPGREPIVPEKWDGGSAEEIVKIILCRFDIRYTQA